MIPAFLLNEQISNVFFEYMQDALESISKEELIFWKAVYKGDAFIRYACAFAFKVKPLALNVVNGNHLKPVLKIQRWWRARTSPDSLFVAYHARTRQKFQHAKALTLNIVRVKTKNEMQSLINGLHAWIKLNDQFPEHELQESAVQLAQRLIDDHQKDVTKERLCNLAYLQISYLVDFESTVHGFKATCFENDDDDLHIEYLASSPQNMRNGTIKNVVQVQGAGSALIHQTLVFCAQKKSQKRVNLTLFPLSDAVDIYHKMGFVDQGQDLTLHEKNKFQFLRRFGGRVLLNQDKPTDIEGKPL